MVGLHAAMMIMLGRFSSQLHLSYTIFIVLGTLGAIQFPVVGNKPLRDMEHVGPLGVFIAMQVMAFCEWARNKYKMSEESFKEFRFRVFAIAVALVAVSLAFFPAGYWGPISNRVRSLFIKHTHTGNPLVDSVAEHQVSLVCMV